MKRFLSLILIPILTTALAVPTASAIGWNYKLFSKMLGGKDPDQYNLTWNSLFGQNEENFGQDLYLQTYQNVVYKPESEAIRETAQRHGLTLTEAQQILNGSITPLLRQKNRPPNFSQNEAFDLALSVQNTFEEAKTFKNLESEFAAASEPTEIFANGDLSDSGFDLIADLDVIEYYLFIERTPNKVNKTLGFISPSGEKINPGSGVKLDYSQTPPSYSSYDSNILNDAGSGEGYAPDNGAGADNGADKFPLPRLIASTIPIPGSTADTSDSLFSSLSASGAACKKESPLEKALDDYDSGNPEKSPPAGPGSESGLTLMDSGYPDAPDSTDGDFGNSSSDSPESAADAPDSPSSLSSTSGTDGSPSLTSDVSSASGAAAKNDFPRDSGLCDDLKAEETEFFKEYSTNANNKNIASFCFAIKTKTRNYSSFSPTKPCINCTIARINESFKETVSHSLVPSKLTGNIFESAKCKDGVNISDTLDMNVFFIPMPILTPPKYSEYEGHNIVKEFDLFARKYLPYSASRKKQNLPLLDEETARSNEAVQQCLKYADINTTQTDLLDCTNKILASEKGRQDEAITEALDATSLQISAELYQPLEKELNRMISFFRIFQDAFSEVSSKSCPNLNNKPSK